MRTFWIVFALILLSGCVTNLSSYRDTKPAFVLEDFFNGPSVAYGMVQDYTGKKIRHFCVKIDGSWAEINGNLVGTIDETFHFNDGEISKRIWEITRHQHNGRTSYTGTAGDIEGVATGSAEGSVFHWNYDLKIPIADEDGEKTTYTFFIDDWIYLIEPERAFNRSTIEKLGITVGEITLFFDKQLPLRSCGSVKNG
jgi:hypothetical protein